MMSKIGLVMWTDYELQIVWIISTGCINGNLTLNDQGIHKLADVDNYEQRRDIEDDIMPPGHEVLR